MSLKYKGKNYPTLTIGHLVTTAKTTAQKIEKIKMINKHGEDEINARQPIHTCENNKISHWNIPRKIKCVIRLTNHFQGYYVTKREDYFHELVNKGHYTTNIPCNRLYQINKVKSESVTPRLITKVIRNNFVTQITSVPPKSTLIIKSVFRHKSHKMTGKTSGAPKPPPIGTAPVGTSILPSGTATSPPSAKASMGAPGSLAKASTLQGTPSKGNGNAKPDKIKGKLNGPKVEDSVNTGPNANGKSKEPPKVQTDGSDKTGNMKGQEKVSLQEELFGASTDSFKLYGSSRPETDIDVSEMETENEELQNNKKRKQAPRARAPIIR